MGHTRVAVVTSLFYCNLRVLALLSREIVKPIACMEPQGDVMREAENLLNLWVKLFVIIFCSLYYYLVYDANKHMFFKYIISSLTTFFQNFSPLLFISPTNI